MQNRGGGTGWKQTPEERMGRLEERMDKVEEGVANFRDFQVDARDFFTRSDERAKHRVEQEVEEKEERTEIDKKRSRIHFWWLGILSGLIVVGFSALLTWALSFEDRHKVSQDHHATRNTGSLQLPQDAAQSGDQQADKEVQAPIGK